MESAVTVLASSKQVVLLERSTIGRYRWYCEVCGGAGPWRPDIDGLYMADDGMARHAQGCTAIRALTH